MTGHNARLARHTSADELRLFDDPTQPTLPEPSLPEATPGELALGERVPPMPVPVESASPVQPLASHPLSDDQPFTVQIERSAKRKRTVGAQLVGDVLKIVIPSWMSRAEEDHWVGVMTGRFRRKVSTDRIDLAERSTTLSRRHDLPRPREIRWSDDMLSRWGSCSPSAGTIRVSSRIAKFPDWVIDYVLIHELAHLEVGDHSSEFWRLVHRYPKSERAIGYLIAKSGDTDDAD